MSVTVLIVDDDASVTKSLVRLLGVHGYSVRGETSAAKAITAATEHPPTVIILDMHMSQRSGIELAREIRQHAQLASTRLIGMTATLPDWDAEAMAAFDAVLTKPFLADALLTAIRADSADSYHPNTSRARR